MQVAVLLCLFLTAGPVAGAMGPAHPILTAMLAPAAVQTPAQEPAPKPAPPPPPATTRAPAQAADQQGPYSFRAASPSGTGKIYMGREISVVLGHRGMAWLERPERAGEERPDLLVANLGLETDDVIADLGAGSGYVTFRISPLVPKGRVLAVDIQSEMLDAINRKKSYLKVSNVVTILGTATDAGLPPDRVDAVLIVDSYHEFSHPREMMESVLRGLRPGGRLILVEYRGEDPRVPIYPLHKMTEKQVRREMEAVGFEWVDNRSVLPRHHLIVVRKPVEDKEPGGRENP